MSKIDELLAELCPKGVPRSSIGELCKVETGKRDANEGSDDGQYHFFTTAKKTGRIDTYRWDCDALLIAGNANIGNVKQYNGKFDAYQRTYVLSGFRPDVDVRYLYFALSDTLNFYLDANKNVAAMTYIVLKTLVDFEVPVPPIEVQREIVSILDKFTQLEAELEAELEARRSQFTYFVDRIFDLDGSHNAPSEPLKSACRITRASGLEKSQLQGEGLPVVQYGEIHMHYDTVATSSRSFADPLIAGKLQRANPGDVILVTTSEDVKDVGNPLVWLGPTPIGVGGESLIMEHDLDPVYLGMFFKSNSFYSQKLPYENGSKVKRISTSNLQKILIPVPERGVQKMLGENLLALENLVKSASVGLPAEIAARRKQYEHCRNKLLTFKELETA